MLGTRVLPKLRAGRGKGLEMSDSADHRSFLAAHHGYHIGLEIRLGIT